MLNHAWKSLISVDMDAGKIVIYDATGGKFSLPWLHFHSPQTESFRAIKGHTGRNKDQQLI